MTLPANRKPEGNDNARVDLQHPERRLYLHHELCL